MCLLTKQDAGTIFDDNFLIGVYSANPDGIGVMWAEKDVLYTVKHVPKDFAEFKAFFDEHINGRECTWHARWRTHGDINTEMVHPYEVLSQEEGYPLYLMHNGVLHTGNAKDKTKSDTWHFIQDYLRPMLLKNPEFFLTDAFKDLIENFIGDGNKFALLDAYGNRVTINEQEFVEYNGALLSNTYAWDTTGTEHDYKSSWKNYGLKGYAGKKVDPAGRPLDDDTEETCAGWLQDDEESDLFAEEVFDKLVNIGMDKAYKHISYKDLENYFYKFGSKAAWEIVDLIEYGCWTDDEFIEEIVGEKSIGTTPYDNYEARM